MKTAILVIAYEAEGFIEKLLGRIPDRVAGEKPVILVSDDASSDTTADRARSWRAAHPEVEMTVLRQDVNLGYGGNQKFCFAWAAEQGADVAVLLHGDEQYPPECIADLVAPFADDRVDAVYGARTMVRGDARRGGMPLGRFLGNRFLSHVFNLVAGTSFSEWFSGFRAYRVATFSRLDTGPLTDGFDFDAAVTLGLHEAGCHIVEVPIPTHYGTEMSRVPLLRTGMACLRDTINLRIRLLTGRRRALR